MKIEASNQLPISSYFIRLPSLRVIIIKSLAPEDMTTAKGTIMQIRTCISHRALRYVVIHLLTHKPSILKTYFANESEHARYRTEVVK